MSTLPDLVSLSCFLAAAEHLSFRAAAESVALSPAAFSDRIRRLEDELGAALFQRTTRKVSLTEAGRRLLPQARRTLAEARRCALSVASADNPVPFALTIGTRFELGLSWLVPALGALQAERPERTLHLSFGEADDLMQRMRAGRIDAVVSSARFSGGRSPPVWRSCWARTPGARPWRAPGPMGWSGQWRRRPCVASRAWASRRPEAQRPQAARISLSIS